MNLVTSQQMQEIDRRAQEEYAIPGLVLMEQAGVKGFHAAMELLEQTDPETPLLFIAGSGNNGGDALVMAREASMQGFIDVSILLVKEELGEAAALQLAICRRLGLPVYTWEDDDWRDLINGSETVFDGITGTGLQGPLRKGAATEIIEYLNSIDYLTIVAIDIPSGMGDYAQEGSVILDAELTVTFGLNKQLFYLPAMRMHCGEVITINPGFPAGLLEEYHTGVDLIFGEEAMLSELPADAYKNRKGHIAVFAGSAGYTGAAALASEAALRAGAGLVTLFCDRDIYQILAGKLSSVIVKPVEEGDLIPAKELSRFDVILAGPGWGTEEYRSLQLGEILRCDTPVVLDADAIRLFAGLETGKTSGGMILTPHPGEFRALAGEESGDLYGELQRVSNERGAVILYKSFINYIAGPDGSIAVMEGMNPKMGTAGSGDVLSGIVSAMVLRAESPFEAAIVGNTIHQAAGNACCEDRGTFISEELLAYIGKEVERVEKRS